MPPESTVKQLEAELGQLDTSHQADRHIDHRGAMIQLALVSVAGLIILGFLLTNFLYFRTEWTEAKFAQSLQAELEVLNPEVSDQLRAMGKNLMPVYVEEGRRQLPRVAPAFSRALTRQLDRFAADFQTDAYARLGQTEDRVRARTMDVVFASYPSMRSPAEQAKLDHAFRTITDTASTQAIEEFHQRFSRDAAGLQRAILDFDVPDPDESTVDLQKKFIHLWLQLLDEEIMKL